MTEVDTLCNDLANLTAYFASQRCIAGIDVNVAMNSHSMSIATRIQHITALNVHQSTQLINAVKDGPWTDEQKSTIVSAISERLANGGLNAAATSQPQAFEHLNAFLTQKDWDLLAGHDTADAKQRVIVARLRRLGLHSLDERSLGHVAAAVLVLTRDTAHSMSGPQKLAVVHELKAQLRLKRGEQRQNTYLQKFPSSPALLPAPMRAVAYGDETPVTHVIAGLEFMQNNVPLRSSHKSCKIAVSPPAASSSSLSTDNFAAVMMNMFNTMMSKAMPANNVSVNQLRPSPQKRQLAITDALADAGDDDGASAREASETPPRQSQSQPASLPPLRVASASDIDGLLARSAAAFAARKASAAGGAPAAATTGEADEEQDDDDDATPNADASERASAAQSRTAGAKGKAKAKSVAKSHKKVTAVLNTKVKAKATAKPKAAPKAKQAKKAGAAPLTQKPKMPKLSGTPPTVLYHGGKIYTSLNSKKFRVLTTVGDRVDRPVSWNKAGGPAEAWAAALELIDNQRASE
jgi:hypothetical protein